MTTQLLETRPDYRKLEAYLSPSPPQALGSSGLVRGVALPFETSNERPGASFVEEEDGEGFRVVFFDYSTYAATGLDWQLALPAYGGRVVFMWQHGGVDPLTGQITFSADIGTLPIGNVERLYKAPSPEGRPSLWFDASYNETHVAQEIRKATLAGSVKEVSTAIEGLEWEFLTDTEDRTFRRVTRYRLWDVSQVTRAQFGEARVVEQMCQDCQGRLIPPVPHQTLPSSEEPSAREMELRQAVGMAQGRVVQLETALRVAGLPLPPEPADTTAGC